MMVNYPHVSITINRRVVSLTDILDSKEKARDDFEANTFDFISQWFSDQQHFEIQTSGSTGPPKVITFHRDQMISSARMTEKALSLKPDYTALVCLDTRFIAGRMMLVRCFITGMAIQAVTPTSNPFAAAALPIDFTALVPYQVYHLLDSAESPVFNSICAVIIGGAALDASVIPRLQKFSAQFYATYGMTETISHVALQKLNGLDQSPLFKVLPGVSISTDDRGCLVIKVPFLSSLLTTNDLVDLKSDSEFQWLGRWDNVLNSGGVKVIPERVEEDVLKVFKRLDIERRFFISSIPDVKLGDKIVLFIEGGEISLQDQERLSRELSLALGPYENPKEAIVLATFEMTQSGKLNRFSMRQNSDKSLQKFTLKK